ncbi:hypothetical protein OIO90_005670 [Microbotryomycetes sp. JL221]|nr:hypothetical protein OIO90_005670 [Microbotryomycetes sp. JL221]
MNKSTLWTARQCAMTQQRRVRMHTSPLQHMWITRSLFQTPTRLEPPTPPQHNNNNNKTRIGQIQRRLQITFTCTANLPTDNSQTKPCHHRSTHEFSKHSYDKGIVIVECPNCQNKHLIADHLGWFSTTPSPAHPQGLPFDNKQPRTIEQLMKEKGQQVKFNQTNPLQGGTWELTE